VIVNPAPAYEPIKVKPLPDPKKEKDNTMARVLLKAPLDVQIKVDGQLTERTEVEQAFPTPKLEPGMTYSYTVTAEAIRDGKTVTASKKVRVMAGEEAQVDFNDLAAEAAEQATNSVAQITVNVPQDARVYVDGTLVPDAAATKTFATPELKAGKSYFYDLKAEVVREGKKTSETRRIYVEAGQKVNVEFKKLADLQTASR
jgi:uncharacterized protein (TIGR03000 family)